MREILFKAKRKDNDEWVYGYYFHEITIGWDIERHIITTGKVKVSGAYAESSELISYEINPNTLCQYTGLTDKNGNKIWENDVVKIHIFHEIAEGYGNHVREQGVVCYDSIGMLSIITDMFEDKPCYSDILFQVELAGIEFDIEAIGNTFDNPELLDK